MSDSQAVYNITDKLGACVILNIESFEKGRQKMRTGTECDKLMIEKTFVSFGYEVHPVQNPTKNDITLKMNEILQTDHTESSSFICFIMSHGTTKNRIITHDNIKMDLNDIIKLSDIPALEGKPKIFVVQTCRGKRKDRGMEAGKGENINPFPIQNDEFEAMIPIANKPDFLLIFATPPGHVSYRNSKGSAFIQMFCHVLEEHRHKATVCALLQRLIFTISCIPFKVKNEIGWFLQVPYFSSTLRKSLKLHHSASSGDIRFKKVNTIKYSRADVARRRIVRLLQAVGGVDSNDVPFHKSGDSLYHKFLLEETSGCYDMSLDRVRSCLIIDNTTDGAIHPAEKDRDAIKQTMDSLQFTCRIFKGKDILAEKYEESMTSNGKLIGCFFCFIQINEEDYIPENTFLTEIIGTVKNKSCLLHKPKIFIIQPYDSVVHSVTDSISHSSESYLGLPVRYSKESDVLIIQTLPVESGQKSFIDIFCNTYLEWAGKVPMMGFLERILPTQHQEDWMALRPVVCSTMRKHLLITDSFYVALYKSENMRQEEELCEELEMIARGLEERISKKFKTTDSSNPQDLLRREDDSDLMLSRVCLPTGTL